MTNGRKAESLLKSGWLKQAERIGLWLALFGLSWQWRYALVRDGVGGEYFEYGSVYLYASDVLILGLLIVWVMEGARRIQFGPKVIAWPLALFLVWMAMSIGWADDKLLALATTGHWLLLYGFWLYLINRIKDINQVVWPLVWGLVGQAVWGVGQFMLNGSFGFLLGRDILTEPQLDPDVAGTPVVIINGIRQLRAHGMLPHANVLGGLMAMGAGWALFLNRKNRAWWLMVPLAVAIILSFSRSGWLALGVVMIATAFWAIWEKRRELFWPLVALLVTLGGMVMWQYSAVTSRFDLTQDLEQRSVTERIASVEIWQEVSEGTLLTGVGIGNYTKHLTSVIESQPSWWYQPVHNIFLLMIGELGWVGLALLLQVMLGVVILGGRLFMQKRLGLWSVLPMAAWLLVGFFDHWPWTFHQGYAFMFVALALIILELNVSLKKVNREY